jgi:hypothetical protein
VRQHRVVQRLRHDAVDDAPDAERPAAARGLGDGDSSGRTQAEVRPNDDPAHPGRAVLACHRGHVGHIHPQAVTKLVHATDAGDGDGDGLVGPGEGDLGDEQRRVDRGRLDENETPRLLANEVEQGRVDGAQALEPVHVRRRPDWQGTPLDADAVAGGLEGTANDRPQSGAASDALAPGRLLVDVQRQGHSAHRVPMGR